MQESKKSANYEDLFYKLPKETLTNYTVFAGDNHVFVLSKEGKLYAWGDTTYGQLGLNDTNNRNAFAQVNLPEQLGPIQKIKAGYKNTFILSKKGELYACGKNTCGQLGFSDTAHHPTFNKTHTHNAKIRDIVTGPNHTLLLLSTNDALGCGNTSDNQLGFGTEESFIDRFIPIGINYPVSLNHPSDNPFSVSPPIQSITAEKYQTIWLSNDNLYAYGNDKSHLQLTLNGNPFQKTITKLSLAKLFPQHTNPRVKKISGSPRHTLIQMNDNKLYGCGKNEFGQLGTNTSKNFMPVFDAPIECFFAGPQNTFFLSEGSLYGCGRNDAGQLGLGYNQKKINTPSKILIDGIKDLSEYSIECIEVSAYYTFLLLSNGEWYVSGDVSSINEHGQGFVPKGNTSNYANPTPIKLNITTDNNRKPNIFTPCDFKTLLEQTQKNQNSCCMQ
jgi:alpha-tubulin suppressor-like RCC1 family protein